jgi:hypothetical protein
MAKVFEQGDVELLKQWAFAKLSLAKAKKDELALRNEIIERLLPPTVSGTTSALVGNYKVKGTFALTHSLDQDMLGGLMGSLSSAEAACIDMKPSLIKKDYLALEESERKTLDLAVTCKPSQPTITVSVIDD